MHSSRLVCATALLVTFASTAGAQLSVGGNLGLTFDTSEDWLVIGADARLPLGKPHWVFNPRASYTPGDGFSSIQIDGNLLYTFEVPSAARVAPYAGVGALLRRDSFDSPGVDAESNVGYNLISGLTFKSSGRVTPYVHAQYTVIQEYPNQLVAFAGALFSIGSKSARVALPTSRR